ncbi:hypothetical protein ACLB2K_045886 [Fragaria x ananassa]
MPTPEADPERHHHHRGRTTRPPAAVVRPARPSLRQLFRVASVACGIQFGWALQLSLLTPYVQELGIPHAWASVIWLCGPLSGLIVQPMVGHMSDRSTSRFGRRRPFIVAGAACIAVSVLIIGYSADIGWLLGDRGGVRPRAIGVFVFGFWILDVANNVTQGPCRALLADLTVADVPYDIAHRCLIEEGYEADVRTRLKVRTSVCSPPSGAGDGAPPPQKTPGASPTTFPPRRIHSFPVFRRDHPKLQTKSISPETGKKRTRRGGEVVGDAAGVFCGGGAPSPAPEDGERTDVRTLSRVRTSAIHPFCIYIYIYIQARSEAHVRTFLKVRTSLCSPPSGADDGTPPPQKTPAASPTTFLPRRVCSFPVFKRDHPRLTLFEVLGDLTRKLEKN